MTWIGWIRRYAMIDPNTRPARSSAISSEWSQILALVWFTKYLVERDSKDANVPPIRSQSRAKWIREQHLH